MCHSHCKWKRIWGPYKFNIYTVKKFKINDLLEYSLLKIMYNAHLKTLPEKLQNRFIKRVSKFNFRGTEVFQKPECRTKLKSVEQST